MRDKMKLPNQVSASKINVPHMPRLGHVSLIGQCANLVPHTMETLNIAQLERISLRVS